MPEAATRYGLMMESRFARERPAHEQAGGESAAAE